MAEYIDREKLINDGIAKGFCDWYDEIKYAQKEDVVEREKIDKAIEEMDKLASHKVRPISFDQAVAIDMCIEILKRNIGE